jgi:hypothetical protein
MNLWGNGLVDKWMIGKGFFTKVGIQHFTKPFIHHSIFYQEKL